MNEIIPPVLIVNVVTLWDVNSTIAIIPKKGKKKQFNAEIIKVNKNCCLVFKSGKIIATGFKSVEETRNFMLSIFKRINFLKIVNITGVIKFTHPVSANKIFQSGLKIVYEPELLPALTWRENGTTFIYYPKGSLIITGAKSISQLIDSASQFCYRFCSISFNDVKFKMYKK